MTARLLNRIAIDAGDHWRKPPFPGTSIRGSRHRSRESQV